MNVFTYGSLMYNRVWSRVVVGTYARKSGVVHGYQRLRVKNEHYPGLIKGDGVVDGVVYLEVSAAEVTRLDKFEGGLYQREEVAVVCEGGTQLNAHVYVIRDEFKAMLNGEWSPTEFEKTGLRAFEAGYSGFDQI